MYVCIYISGHISISKSLSIYIYISIHVCRVIWFNLDLLYVATSAMPWYDHPPNMGTSSLWHVAKTDKNGEFPFPKWGFP